MSRYSKKTRKNLDAHCEKISTLITYYDDELYYNDTHNTINHLSITLKNKNLADALLIEVILINNEISTLLKNGSNSNRFSKIKLLLCKKLFRTDKYFKKSYLRYDLRAKFSYRFSNTLYLITRKLHKKITSSKQYDKGVELLIKLRDLLFLLGNLIRSLWLILSDCGSFIKYDIILKWHVYLARIVILSVINFIPFIQLGNILLYNQCNPRISDPILSYLGYLCPPVVRFIHLYSPAVTKENFSFLMLIPYFYFFCQRFKQWGISRKIAYQGALALSFMLFRYCLLTGQEIAFYIFKYAKPLFFLNQYQNLELLRDDLSFYIEDLEETRFYCENIAHLGANLHDVEDLAIVTKIYDATSIFALLAVIALLYNYMYFICRGKKPIIPVVTKTVKRMITDRPPGYG